MDLAGVGWVEEEDLEMVVDWVGKVKLVEEVWWFLIFG